MTLEYKIIADPVDQADQLLARLASQGWKPIMMSSVFNGQHIYATVVVEREVTPQSARYGTVR
jgi:hypothetical protein